MSFRGCRREATSIGAGRLTNVKSEDRISISQLGSRDILYAYVQVVCGCILDIERRESVLAALNIDELPLCMPRAFVLSVQTS